MIRAAFSSGVAPLDSETPGGADDSAVQNRIGMLMVYADRRSSFTGVRSPLSFEALDRPIDDDLDPTTDRYQILEHIGAGGQADVYAAIQYATGRQVALKVFRGGQTLGPAFRESVDRETRLLAALDDPHIVSIFDRGFTSDGFYFLVMPLVRGERFDQWWNRQPRQIPADLVALLAPFIALCEALEQAHCRRIVHRDLKPHNVLIDGRNNPRLLDFGLARDAGAAPLIDGSAPGKLVGTLRWASPEQVAGDQATPCSDVYSIGVMLHEALSGRAMHVSPDRAEVAREILTLMPPAPSTLNHKRAFARVRSFGRGSLWRRIDAVVLRALSKDPVDRQSSSGQLATELRGALRPRTGRAAHQVKSWMKGVPRVAAAAVLGVLLTRSLATQTASSVTLPNLMPTRSNSLHMQFVQIPAGTLMLHQLDGGAAKLTHPVTTLQVHSLWMASTEVTVSQYNTVMHISPTPKHLRDVPKTGVAIADVLEFCRRLSQTDGRNYRLPTDAEFEYAASNGVYSCAYGVSRDRTPLRADAAAWSLENTPLRVQPVATRASDLWGLYDMAGNAAELCRATAPLPPGGSGWRACGGSYQDPAVRCTAGSSVPYEQPVLNPRIGFRLVADDFK